MQQILLVEGSTMFGRVIKKRLEGAFDLPVFWVKTLRETLDLLKQPEGSFSMALLGMNLPKRRACRFSVQVQLVPSEVDESNVCCEVFTNSSEYDSPQK